MIFLMQFIISLLMIYITFTTIRGIDFAKKLGISMFSGQILKIFISISIGYLVTAFFFSIFQLISSFSSSFS